VLWVDSSGVGLSVLALPGQQRARPQATSERLGRLVCYPQLWSTASVCPCSGQRRLLHATAAGLAGLPSVGTGMPLSGSHTSITTQLWRGRAAKRAADQAAVQSAVVPQHTLVPKAPKPTSIRYPFSSDPVLREEYCNPWGKVRLGKLLEDLDSLAGTIAFEHWCGARRRFDSQTCRSPRCGYIKGLHTDSPGFVEMHRPSGAAN
jgi:hypothetical protein